MSRTYRRSSGDRDDLKWNLKRLFRIPGTYHWYWESIEPGTKEYNQIVAKYHSDSHRSFKEPGPAWFRNLTTERPQRREAKRQLHKFMHNPDYEVILNGKDPLDYWT